MKRYPRKPIITIFILVLWILAQPPSVSKAADKIIWHQPDLPPFYILSGPGADQGISDNLKNILLAEMDEFEHKLLKANLTRSVRDMKNGREICHMSLIPNKERRTYMDFSTPYTLLLPPGLIISKDKIEDFKPYLNEKGELKLADILAANKLKATYTRARFYPTPIMNAIETYGKNGTGDLIERIDVAKTDSQTDILVTGDIDGILGYPIVSYYYATLNGTADKISYLRIAGSAPFFSVHAACTKGDWNKSFLNRMNEIIRKHRQTEPFIAATLRWLPENSRETIQEYIKTKLPAD